MGFWYTQFVNNEFVKNIISLRKDLGKKWLKELPQIIKEYEKLWGLEVFPPFHLTYNYVAPAETSDGESVVLKISFPENNEFETEVKAFYDQYK